MDEDQRNRSVNSEISDHIHGASDRDNRIESAWNVVAAASAGGRRRVDPPFLSRRRLFKHPLIKSTQRVDSRMKGPRGICVSGATWLLGNTIGSSSLRAYESHLSMCY